MTLKEFKQKLPTMSDDELQRTLDDIENEEYENDHQQDNWMFLEAGCEELFSRFRAAKARMDASDKARVGAF